MSSRLRVLRRQNRMTLDTLATQAGVTKSYLSKIERGLSVPSISTAMKLAQVLNVDVGRLFADEVEPELITVVRAGERTPVPGATRPGDASYEGIAVQVSSKKLAPFMMYPPPTFAGSAFKSHPGEEFFFVHAGDVELEFPDRTVTLAAGDSVYFNAEVPHRSRSLGKAKAAVLIVIHDDSATSTNTGSETDAEPELGPGPGPVTGKSSGTGCGMP
ncbi:XRE family transcriptional regulator [Streptomyces sp. NPDC003077]|uniref:helix-turn-helix domain-containing protein n=1 Tax=Streptomyces sp. NPDC003077 TaxID=3154443 RepID=UPI0033A138D3